MKINKSQLMLSAIALGGLSCITGVVVLELLNSKIVPEWQVIPTTDCGDAELEATISSPQSDGTTYVIVAATRYIPDFSAKDIGDLHLEAMPYAGTAKVDSSKLRVGEWADDGVVTNEPGYYLEARSNTLSQLTMRLPRTLDLGRTMSYCLEKNGHIAMWFDKR